MLAADEVASATHAWKTVMQDADVSACVSDAAALLRASPGGLTEPPEWAEAHHTYNPRAATDPPAPAAWLPAGAGS
eukprot:gene6566-132_t